MLNIISQGLTREVSIGLENGLAPDMYQAII